MFPPEQRDAMLFNNNTVYIDLLSWVHWLKLGIHRLMTSGRWLMVAVDSAPMHHDVTKHTVLVPVDIAT